jgi:hypothetical protein
MPLRASFPNEDEGRITQKSASVRRYRVGEPADFIDYEETTITETKVWTALTKAAAQEQVEKNPQPSEENAVHSWSYQLESSITGGYTVQRVYERKSAERVD